MQHVVPVFLLLKCIFSAFSRYSLLGLSYFPKRRRFNRRSWAHSVLKNLRIAEMGRVAVFFFMLLVPLLPPFGAFLFSSVPIPVCLGAHSLDFAALG